MSDIRLAYEDNTPLLKTMQKHNVSLMDYKLILMSVGTYTDEKFARMQHVFEGGTEKNNQEHGLVWENDIKKNVYGMTDDEIKNVKSNSIFDLPAEYNRLENTNVSIKTTGNMDLVCMADCLRLFDNVSSGVSYHLVCIYYKQVNGTKIFKSIIEMDITSSRDVLFGTVTREDIEALVHTVKRVPLKRRPSAEEKLEMQRLSHAIQERSGVIKFNIKCDSSQSRLQCSFNKFRKFIMDNPSRIVASSDCTSFRGGEILGQVASGVRHRKSLAEKTV